MRLLKSSYRSNGHSVAFFEFFSAAAWAGIVSSDFGTVAFGLAGFSIAAIVLLRHNELGMLPLAFDLFGLFLFLDRLEKEEKAESVFFDTVHQVFEQSVGFLLVFDKRIALAIAAQSDTFLEMIHCQKVILPMRIDDLQHQHPFVIAHLRRADQRFLLVVP